MLSWNRCVRPLRLLTFAICLNSNAILPLGGRIAASNTSFFTSHSIGVICNLVHNPRTYAPVTRSTVYRVCLCVQTFIPFSSRSWRCTDLGQMSTQDEAPNVQVKPEKITIEAIFEKQCSSYASLPCTNSCGRIRDSTDVIMDWQLASS
jgi:hypothetical protein